MRLTPCRCGVTFLVRLDRTFWMRLIPGRRHYFCVRCHSHQLLSRKGLRSLFPSMAPALDRDVTSPAPLETGAPSELFASTGIGMRRAGARPPRR